MVRQSAETAILRLNPIQRPATSRTDNLLVGLYIVFMWGLLERSGE